MSDKVLVVAIEGGIETLDPNFSRYPTSNFVNLNVYDQLFRYGVDETNEGYKVTNVRKIEGAAIESWEVSDDGLSVRLYVRQGVRFPRTGNEMTADDIIYWYERGLATQSGISWNLETAGIRSLEKVGPYEILVQLRRPLGLFFQLARDQAWGVIDSKEAISHATDSDPWANEWLAKHNAGAGEFVVESWDPGVQMTLAANESYWAGRPYFDKVILRVIPDSSTRAALLHKGDIDIAMGLSPDQLDALRDSEGVRVLSIPSRTEVVVILNNEKPPFDDKRVRQALAYLVPQEEIVRSVFGGRAEVARSVIPNLGRYFNAGFWNYTLDAEKARALLEKAGRPEGLRFTMNVKQGEEISRLLAVTLQTAFRRAGVELSVREVTNAIWAEEMARGTHQATLWAVGHLSYIDDPWYKLRGFYSGSATNRSRYRDTRIDQLYHEMQQVVDSAERRQQADEMQMILVEDVPMLWLANVPAEYAMRSDIRGFTFLQDALFWFYPLHRVTETVR